MTFPGGLLNRVCAAQTANSELRGERLRDVGSEIAALSIRDGYVLMAADGAGERLIGAALVADKAVRAVDSSRRRDGVSVLIVAGHLAGTSGVALTADLAWSLGARNVRAAVLGSEHAVIAGCDRVTALNSQRHLIAL